VRDSRNRQHDPIIGVVPLKLSDVLQTASQSTRWYPLDGGIGFGRVRISLLFRSVELKLPPAQLGFGEIGTFEFLGDKIRTSGGYAPKDKLKLKLRTGGSSDIVKGDVCSRSVEGDGLEWDISGGGEVVTGDSTSTVSGAGKKSKSKSHRVRLPVRYRYRSPVFFEFHRSGKRNADAFAAIWLQDLVDNEEREFDVPIWRCDKGMRLSQNYITEGNVGTVPDLKIEEVGRLHFRGRFKPGTDRDHLRFVSDNDSRETIEAWEACFAEGVRAEHVTQDVPPLIQKLHEESLTHGRDVLAAAPEEDRRKWMAKDGTDWHGAFGRDPKELLEEKRRGESEGSSTLTEYDEEDDTDDDEGGEVADPEHVDLGIDDATTQHSGSSGAVDGGNGYAGAGGARGSDDSMTTTDAANTNAADMQQASVTSQSSSKNPIKNFREYRSRSRDLHRQHRGLMQWKPMRNIQFAKDEAVFAARRIKKVGSLNGRKPDVETEV